MQLIHGECLEEMKKIPDGSVDMVLCDLPYGTTQNKWDSVIPFAALWEQYKRICKGAVVLTAAQPFTSLLVVSNLQDFKYQWVWKKGNKPTGFLNAKKQPLRITEDVVVFYAAQPTYNPVMVQGAPCHTRGGGGKQGKHQTDNYGAFSKTETVGTAKYPQTLIDIPRDARKVHPTQKPVALMEYMVRTYSNEGDTILDNTMGSGTTGVACVNASRHFIGIEQDPGYFAIAERRIAEAQQALALS